MGEPAVRDSALLERLQALVAAPPRGDGAPDLAFLEDSVTDGYARALLLEAERTRISRSIGSLVAVEGEDAEHQNRELRTLSRRLACTDTELASLRNMLGQLRTRAMALRSAPAS